MVTPFRLGRLSEDDLDGDYEPGRSEETMSAEHKQSLDDMVARVRAQADKVRKREDEPAITIVLEPER